MLFLIDVDGSQLEKADVLQGTNQSAETLESKFNDRWFGHCQSDQLTQSWWRRLVEFCTIY